MTRTRSIADGLSHHRLERITPAGERQLIATSHQAYLRTLRAGEPTHRELRPSLPHDYAGAMDRLFAEGTTLTQCVHDGEVVSLALWRVFTTTYCGRRLEVDDLVTAAAHRSAGYGRTLLRYLEAHATTLGCSVVTLNSATHRSDAHRFYFRERYAAIAFHFSKELPIGE